MYQKDYYYIYNRISKYKIAIMATLALNISFSQFVNADVSSYEQCKSGEYCATFNYINPYNQTKSVKNALTDAVKNLPDDIKKDIKTLPTYPSELKDNRGQTYTEYSIDFQKGSSKWKRTPYGGDYVKYTDDAHKNVSVNINNLDSQKAVLKLDQAISRDVVFELKWQGLEFKAHGKNSTDKITIGSPDSKALINQDISDPNHYRNLNIDLKDAIYYGDITLKGSNIADTSDQRVANLDGNLVNLVAWRKYSDNLKGHLSELQKYYPTSSINGVYLHLENVEFNGNIHLENVGLMDSGTLGSKPLIIKNSTINGDLYWRSSNTLDLQLENDIFKNSHLSFLRDSFKGVPVVSNQNITMKDLIFIDSSIQYAYAPTAKIDETGTQGSYDYTNNTFINTNLEVQDGSIRLYFNHNTFDGGKIKLTSNAKITPTIVDINGSKVNVSSLEIGGESGSLGAMFNFGKMTHSSTAQNQYSYEQYSSLNEHSTLTMSLTQDQIKASKTNASKDILTDFSGDIYLTGGKNIFNIQDESTLHNGTIYISGGDNTFNIKDKSSLDKMNIKVSSGEKNTFNFNNSTLKGNIDLIGGKSNALSFSDSSKVGGHIFITGGEKNDLSFTQSAMSSSLSAMFSPDSSKSDSSKMSSMSPIRLAILSSSVNEAFLNTIQKNASEKFKGDIIIRSDASFENTKNTLTFSNTGIDGNIVFAPADGVGKSFYTELSATNVLLNGNMTFDGAGMITRETFNKSAIFGNINISNGSSYLELDDSQLYGNIVTRGGINVVSLKNNSVFAGSIDTYGGTSYIDISQSMAMGQNNAISNINTYGGMANITLSINSDIAKLIKLQKVNPVFEVANYNNSLTNIGIFGPVTGTGHINYSGGNVNLFFADGGDGDNPKRFFAKATSCPNEGFVSGGCLVGGVAEFSPKKDLYSKTKTEDGKTSLEYWNRFVRDATKVGKGVFKVNGYTGLDGIAFSFDAQKANEILSPFRGRDEYLTNYASISVDKSDAIDSAKTKESDRVYRMKLSGVFVGAEYNLTSSNSKRKYEVTFDPNTVFVGSMDAATDNTDFILDQGVKFVAYSKSNFNISSLLAKKTFDINTEAMFDSTLAQKGNVIIDLATEGKVASRTFHKDSFSTMIIGKMDNVNNAIFRIAIDATKSDANNNINTNAKNTDRIVIKSVGDRQHLKNYLQIYQDYTNLKTGNLADNHILVAVSKNTSDSGAEFDTSSSDVKQGFDIVHTDIIAKPIALDESGNIDLTPDSGKENAIGYFVDFVSAQLDSSDLNKTDNAIASNYSIFLANINDLNKRLGEIRDNFYAQGVYSRVFNGLNENNYGAEISKIYSTNIQFGYDYGWKTRNGVQFVGGAATYGYNSIKGGNYNGNAQLGEVAGYYSYVDDSGIFLDTILKYTYIHNNISLKDNYFSNTPLSTHIGSLGVEVGYRYYMDNQKSYYLEPSAEFIGAIMGGGDINQASKVGLLNDTSEPLATLNTSLSGISALRSKLGATFGYRLMNSTNETHLRLSGYYVGDFNTGGDLTYSTKYSSESKSLLNSNHQLMISLGVNSVLNENWRVYADVDAGFLGQYFDQNYLISAGLRYEFGQALTPFAARIAQEKKDATAKRKEILTSNYKVMVAFNDQKFRQDDEFKKFQARIVQQVAQNSGNKSTQAKLIAQKRDNEIKYIKESHELELATLNKKQEAQMKELQLKHQNQEKMLALRQANRLSSANNSVKASLKAAQTKETKKLQTKEEKELSELKAAQTKELKALQAKHIQEIEKLQASQAAEAHLLGISANKVSSEKISPQARNTQSAQYSKNISK